MAIKAFPGYITLITFKWDIIYIELSIPHKSWRDFDKNKFNVKELDYNKIINLLLVEIISSIFFVILGFGLVGK